MKKLLIISGKGGTGKTTTSAAFIYFSKARAFADCDVDAPNLHLLADFTNEAQKTVYYGSQKACIEEDKCNGCGKCRDYCRFDAITVTQGRYTVNEYACEGCGVCEITCPVHAVALHEDAAGTLSLYNEQAVFSTATLKMGRGNSGKLVSAVKTALFQQAPPTELAIIDGSPGIGCPVIASISGVDMVLIVTEPSLSGRSDLARLVKTVAGFQTKMAVCINTFDVCPEQTDEIEAFCAAQGVPVVGRVPYDRAVPKAINTGVSVGAMECPAGKALQAVYERTMGLLMDS
jgi:MinD superfamily P-loop ATPase